MINLLNNVINSAFYNILYMSVIGTFVGIFILVIRKIFDKRISPKWKCIIWILLLVSLVVPVKITVKTKQENLQILSISGLVQPIQNIYKTTEENSLSSSKAESQEVMSEETTSEETISQEGASKETISEEYASEEKISQNNYNGITQEANDQNVNWKKVILNNIIPTIWFLGIIFNVILLNLGSINIKNKIKGKIYTDDTLSNLVNKCRKSIGVKQKVNIILQSFKKTPSIIGVIRPQILITQKFLKQDYKTQKYIIMHELSHYKRKDLQFNYILLLITIIHWFNPFVWMFFKKIRQDIELATDEMVLNKLNNEEKTEYGMTLINSLQIFQNENYTAKLLCVTDDNKNMERRIRMIKLSDKFSKNKIIIALISIIIIIIAFALFFTTNNNTTNTALLSNNSVETSDDANNEYNDNSEK